MSRESMIRQVTLSCVQLLEGNPLRSSDAIQIASALAWHADLFVSADAKQCAAAKAAGLDVVKL
jgi:predicted nucleic acid-binding protein